LWPARRTRSRRSSYIVHDTAAAIKFLRRSTSGATGNGLGTAIKYLRGAAGTGLGTTIKYLVYQHAGTGCNWADAFYTKAWQKNMLNLHIVYQLLV
jgi:hypothetical protein